MSKKHWWNTQDDIEIISHTAPLDQSSPKRYNVNDLSSNSITEDLEDSLLRLETIHQNKNILEELNEHNGPESIVSSAVLETSTDERGRKITVMNDRPISRSRSRTPFRIRDNFSHLFGWDKVTDPDPEYDEGVSKMKIEIPDSQSTDTKSKLRYWKPCSRLGLLNNDQYSAFNFELSLIKNHINDFPLNFPWVVWITKDNKTEVKTMVENAIDLKLSIKYMKSIHETCKIMVFRLGVLPKRKAEENIGGISIDFQVDHANDFEVFKDIVKMSLNGVLYKPDIDLVICGVLFKRKATYSIISCWIHPPQESFDESNVFDPVLVLNLIESIKCNLQPSYQSVVDSAVIVENKTLKTTGVFV